jgi:hypothetical protein
MPIDLYDTSFRNSPPRNSPLNPFSTVPKAEIQDLE